MHGVRVGVGAFITEAQILKISCYMLREVTDEAVGFHQHVNDSISDLPVFQTCTCNCYTSTFDGLKKMVFFYDAYTGLNALKRKNVKYSLGFEKRISVVADFVPTPH